MTQHERIETRISDAELARRWDAVRQMMLAEDLDALVVRATDDWLGGTLKWLTDLPANNGYPRSIVFPRDDFMAVVDMGAFDGRQRLGGSDPVLRGVDEVLTTPLFSSVRYTHGYDSALVARLIAERGFRRIGLVGSGVLPSAYVDGLRAALPGVAFSDPTESIDRIKAIKSPEEILLIKATAQMQDQVFAAVLDELRPGMRDVDVTALAQYHGQRLGSEQGLFLIGSSPLGRPVVLGGRHMQGRRFGVGDHFSLLIENNGAGGFYTEIMRTVVIGSAPDSLLACFETARQAQEHTLSRLKPGVAAADVAAAHDEWMRARGLPPETRLYSHGQGYDLVERPLIRRDETMTIETGMCLAVHPGFQTSEALVVICDNYLIGADGPGECLHRTEKRIFELR
jgi:Xaa-Pro aminopeptidase